MSVSFSEYFRTLYGGRSPFPWQERLAAQVACDGWPDVIDLPTASGKTSCIDVALYCLATAPKMPRRIFYVVDRRIIVDDTYRRYSECRRMLAEATDGPLREIADRLRENGKSESPLEVQQMRGGIYRDVSWVRDPLQPTIVTSTVDQVGSRLLFRGYGVSPNTAAVHAGLIANDSLVFLDEAHCSRAFARTLRAIGRYRSDAWSVEHLGLPFHVVQMTATPTETPGHVPFRIDDKDRSDVLMKRRMLANKPASLHEIAAKPSDSAAVAKQLVTQAARFAEDGELKRHAIIANRIATAKAVAEELRRRFPESGSDVTEGDGDNVTLVIGRMRPIDRDDQMKVLDAFRTSSPRTLQSPRFLVSTQCIEVGADLDFDSLTSECASIDALVQRFGRLDRLGDLQGKAKGAVIMPSKAIDAKLPDPIYGRALERTWEWLKAVADRGAQVDFGIEAAEDGSRTVAQRLREFDETATNALRRIGPDAPHLMPAHLDALCQTSPQPHAEPDVSLFLHGREAAAADIQVVWRADLDTSGEEGWQDRCREAVLVCPPSVAEAMPVRLSTFRRWLDERADSTPPVRGDSDDADVEGLNEIQSGRVARQEPASLLRAVVWRGSESRSIEFERGGRDVAPGDTLVLASTDSGWEVFGEIPRSGLVPESRMPLDFGDRAAYQVRRRTILRLHPGVFSQWPGQGAGLQKLRDLCTDPDPSRLEDLLEALREYRQSDSLPEGHWLAAVIDEVMHAKKSSLSLTVHPSGVGYVLQVRGKVAPALEDSGDETSSEGNEILLEEHCSHVSQYAAEMATVILPGMAEAFAQAGMLHDAGKADLRFQAVLRGGDRLAAELSPRPIAKSAPVSWSVSRRALMLSGLPEGFRHELLSLLIAEAALGSSPDVRRDLVLHLVASHHGRCRPFAPVVVDAGAPVVDWGDLRISPELRQLRAAHRLGSGVTRRFWKLTRRFGWWGLAFMEAVLRTSDWQTSAQDIAREAETMEVEVGQ